MSKSNEDFVDELLTEALKLAESIDDVLTGHNRFVSLLGKPWCSLWLKSSTKRNS